jgi:hypothetical protein
LEFLAALAEHPATEAGPAPALRSEGNLCFEQRVVLSNSRHLHATIKSMLTTTDAHKKTV